VKAKLPRRESERRSHPLARHVDILSAVETRLSLLNMTYSKFIDLGLCCFIPGKVIALLSLHACSVCCLLGFERYRYWGIGCWPIHDSIGLYWYWPNTCLSNHA